MNKDTNKKIAKIIECYDSACGGTYYWVAAELFADGTVSPFAIGEMVLYTITKEKLDFLVKDAMKHGYDEVVLGDGVKKRLGL